MNDPANCDKVIPDLAGLSGFTYGSHYCSVDNKQNATTLACGYFESGIQQHAAGPTELEVYGLYRIPRQITPLPGFIPDLAGLGSFTYGAHYCSVDNRLNATTLACGYFNSGIRVFDIRNPQRPKEIAYYNPASTTTSSPGSNHLRTGGWVAGGPDWCTAQVRLDVATGTLQTTCHDNGFLSLKFTNGVWPFPESTTPAGLQN